jgi:hypothetical protein
MNYGEILNYRDIIIEKNQVLGNYDNIRNLALKILDIVKFDFFVPRENETLQLKQLAKTNIIRELGDDHPFTYNFPNMLSGVFLIVKKSKVSIQLLKEWENACLKDEWINGEQYGELHPSFMWSCPEQSILGVIIANWIRSKKHNIPRQYPLIGFKERDISNIIFYDKDEDYEYLQLDFNINELNINPNKEILKKRINFITNELKVNPELTNKTVALCLAGNSYKKNHNTLYLKNTTINFKTYASNIKFFYKDFKDIDYYLVTNNSEKIDDLKQTYNPTKLILSEKDKLGKIVEILEYLRDTKNIYDFISISRFDIYYMNDLRNVNLNKMNIMSILEHDDLICDNFYLFPYKFIHVMIDIFKNATKYTTFHIPSHGLKNIIEDKIGINYLKNEFVSVQELSSYYIHI